MNTPQASALLSKHQPRKSQQGIALVFVLLMLVIAFSMAVITARMTLQGDKATRNDRDRQIAFQAAELALHDAELDLMDVNLTDKAKKSGGSNKGRACKIGNPEAHVDFEPGCGKKSDGDRLGLCRYDPANPSQKPYQRVDWGKARTSNDRSYVNFGEFTGRGDQLINQLSEGFGNGVMSAMPPKYIIVESIPRTFQIPLGGSQTYQMKHAYKVYALGYGASKDTQVMLEAEFYKPLLEQACTAESAPTPTPTPTP